MNNPNQRGETRLLFLVCIVLAGFSLGCQSRNEKAQATAPSPAAKTGPSVAPQTTAKPPQGGGVTPTPEKPSSATGAQAPVSPHAAAQPSQEGVVPTTTKTIPEPAKHSAEVAAAGEGNMSKAEDTREPHKRTAGTDQNMTAAAKLDATPTTEPTPPPATPPAQARETQGNIPGTKATTTSGVDGAHQAKSASLPAPPPVPIGMVNASRLNLRQGPDPTSTKLTALPQGEEVKILGEQGDWYHVTIQNGSLEGWVAKRYVDVNRLEKSANVSAKASPDV